MKCPKCRHENRSERRFCAECGAALGRICAGCGAANEPGEKFCGECGAALDTPVLSPVEGRPQKKGGTRDERAGTITVLHEHDSRARLTIDEGERKTITALFADIKGSMELMEDLDPEEARRIVDPALQLMMEAVHRYDGYVAQSTGDGIFALFGAPVAREDHPQRALYAALRLQEEMRRYAARLRVAGTPPIEARVGVNTGEVVVRALATG